MLENLRKILPVPTTPIDVDLKVAKLNERILGTRFPDDFLQFGVTYGSGQICVGPYTWEIFSPCREAFPAIVREFVWIHNQEREAQEQFDLPIGLYPEPNGLLPFANRDHVWFTWMTSGDANSWPVVAMWDYFEDSYHVYKMGFSKFLYAFLTRNTEMIGYTMDWSSNEVSFEPRVFFNPPAE